MSDDDLDVFEFGVLDREADVDVRERNLPHWFQPGAATFITFRTADSLPREVHVRMQRELEQWLTSRGLPVGIAKSNDYGKVANWDTLWKELSRVQTREYNKLRHRLFQAALDDCHGECLLKQSDVASIVAEAIPAR